MPRGSGQPLPESVQKKMEVFFNTSFADVRVHVGHEASSIGALAFTHGTDLYFAPGQYNPQSAQGQQLLGHELTHVLQQRAGRVRNPLGAGIAVVQDPALEAEAERMGLGAARPAFNNLVRGAAAEPAAKLRTGFAPGHSGTVCCTPILQGWPPVSGLKGQIYPTALPPRSADCATRTSSLSARQGRAIQQAKQARTDLCMEGTALTDIIKKAEKWLNDNANYPDKNVRDTVKKEILPWLKESLQNTQSTNKFKKFYDKNLETLRNCGILAMPTMVTTPQPQKPKPTPQPPQLVAKESPLVSQILTRLESFSGQAHDSEDVNNMSAEEVLSLLMKGRDITYKKAGSWKYFVNWSTDESKYQKYDIVIKFAAVKGVVVNQATQAKATYHVQVKKATGDLTGLPADVNY
jgi:hypothetical protein